MLVSMTMLKHYLCYVTYPPSSIPSALPLPLVPPPPACTRAPCVGGGPRVWSAPREGATTSRLPPREPLPPAPQGGGWGRHGRAAHPSGPTRGGLQPTPAYAHLLALGSIIAATVALRHASSRASGVVSNGACGAFRLLRRWVGCTACRAVAWPSGWPCARASVPSRTRQRPGRTYLCWLASPSKLRGGVQRRCEWSQ